MNLIKVLILIIILISSTFGSTLTKTVRPSNGDYTSINACLNANIAMVEDTLLVTCDSSMIDGTAISLTGGYSSTKWIIITGVGAGRCTTGTYTADGHRFEHSADANGISITDSTNIIFDGLKFKFTQLNRASKVLFGISPITTCKIIIKNCFLKGVVSGTSNNTIGVYCGDRSKVYIINSIITGFVNSSDYSKTVIGVYQIGTACSTFIFNSNITKSYQAIFRTSGTLFISNDYFSTVVTPVQNFVGQRATCAMKDSALWGAVGVYNVPFTNSNFSDTVTDDYSLIANSLLINKGTHNLILTSPLDYTTDFKGITRTKNWDIGAFEYINVAPVFTPYSGPSIKCRTGVPLVDTLKCTDIPWDSCTSDPLLPIGISLNKNTGVISGSTIYRSLTTYKFYIWVNGLKEDSTTLTIRFYKPETISPSISSIPTVQSSRIGIDYLWYGISQYNKSINLSTLSQYRSDLNSKIVRFDVYWYYLEPTKGNFNWDKTDSIIAALPSNVQLLFTLYCTAQWAIKTRDTLTTIMPPNAPVDYNDYYNFVYALATRYKNRVNYYQIENEVYAALPFWYGTSQEYLTLLQTGYSAIRAADPIAKVLPASIALAAVDITQPVPNQYEDALTFIKLVYQSGVNYFDIADIHLYYTLASIPDRFIWFKDIMALNRKPIWVTETGGLDSRAYTNYSDSIVQSIDLIKRYALIFSDSVDKAFWLSVHQTKDVEELPWTGIKLTDDPYAINKRPAYYTLKLLINKIDQFSSASPTTNGVKFTVNNKPVLIVWDTVSSTIDVSSLITTSLAKVTHIITQVNDSIPLVETYNKTSIPIDTIPIFIENN